MKTSLVCCLVAQSPSMLSVLLIKDFAFRLVTIVEIHCLLLPGNTGAAPSPSAGSSPPQRSQPFAGQSTNTRKSRFSNAPPSTVCPEAAAEVALAAGDSIAAMNAYMRLAAKHEEKQKPKPEQEDEGIEVVVKRREIPNGTAYEKRRTYAVYRTDGTRGHHMQDFIPPEEMAKFMAKCNDEAAQKHAEKLTERSKIGADNIGHKLLSKMGWKEGEGLGAGGAGAVAPVEAGAVKQDNLGLGAHAVGDVSADDDMYDQYRKRMMLGYKHRPNPLGNPRRAYY